MGDRPFLLDPCNHLGRGGPCFALELLLDGVVAHVGHVEAGGGQDRRRQFAALGQRHPTHFTRLGTPAGQRHHVGHLVDRKCVLLVPDHLEGLCGEHLRQDLVHTVIRQGHVERDLRLFTSHVELRHLGTGVSHVDVVGDEPPAALASRISDLRVSVRRRSTKATIARTMARAKIPRATGSTESLSTVGHHVPESLER